MFANEYVCDDLLAADIVQDCFVKLWQSRDGFTYIHQIKSFLYTSVRNRSLNELEHSKVKSEYARKVMDSHKDAFFHDQGHRRGDLSHPSGSHRLVTPRDEKHHSADP